MRVCNTCGKEINHLHGNRKICLQCDHQIVGKQRKQEITVDLDLFMGLYENSKELELARKRITEIENVLKDKICTDCKQCDNFNGVCVYGLED